MTGKAVIKSSKANLERGIESVGGMLTLTKDYLEFVPHSINFQKEPISIRVIDLKSVKKSWTRLFSIIPLFPSTVAISTPGGTYRFVVSDRDGWMSAIQGQESA